MPDTIWTGGISEIKKIATMAEAYYIPIAPHVVPGGPLEIIAAAHVVSSIPNFYRLEHAQSLIEPHNSLLQEPYEIKDGHLALNGKPGLDKCLPQRGCKIRLILHNEEPHDSALSPIPLRCTSGFDTKILFDMQIVEPGNGVAGGPEANRARLLKGTVSCVGDGDPVDPDAHSHTLVLDLQSVPDRGVEFQIIFIL